MKNTMCAALGMCIAGGVASGGVIIHAGALPLQATDWASTIMIDQFDTLGGTRLLVDVSWSVTGSLVGLAEIESLDAAATTINATLMSEMQVSLAGDSIGGLSPSILLGFNATPFDGVVDFGGTSGSTMGPLMTSEGMAGSAMDLTPYIGVGQIALDVSATGSAWASGSGNLVTSFTTQGSASYELIYTYREIPTPGAAALLGIAGAVLSGRRRR